jgi:hypothetical protein
MLGSDRYPEYTSAIVREMIITAETVSMTIADTESSRLLNTLRPSQVAMALTSITRIEGASSTWPEIIA